MEAFDEKFDDLERFESFVTETYSRIRLDDADSPAQARVSRRVLTEELALDDIHYGFDMTYESAPDDRLMVLTTTEGRIGCTNAGTDDTFGPGEAFLLNLPDLPYSGRAHRDSRYRLAVIEPALLSRVLAGAGAGTGGPRIGDHRPVSPGAGALVHTVLGQLDELVDQPELAPLLRENAAHYLAAAVLDAFSSEAEPPARELPAQPRSVRRAVAYIDSHAAEPITLGDIVSAAGVTARALQLGFRTHVGVTPMGYLRRVRLDLARRELQAGAATTVAQVAAAWGFGNQGRFGAAYRSAYDETPAETLRAARS